ncbi:MAG: carbohydrate ABC transporter permease [Defluviitaleaceae bacterium]|nr:carbohydrate ABC transporter permease [Defluviitaleaceae bacterium]
MNIKSRFNEWANSPMAKNNVQKWGGRTKNFIFNIVMAIIIVGVCYTILAPVIAIISRTFMSPQDIGNPLVFLFPQEPTLYNLRMAIRYMDYVSTLTRTFIHAGTFAVLSVVVASFVGYGFARFKFPGVSILFALVILSIVVPVQSYMIPMFLNFRHFLGQPDWNLINPNYPIPLLMLTLTGVGIRSGLYIFIFRQFFRGIPKDIEEAAFIDGAGTFGTYMKIMLPNAIPAVTTVFLFSFVWHYNDTYYGGLLMTGNSLMAAQLGSVGWTYSEDQETRNPIFIQLVIFAAVSLAIAPILTIYLFLQRFFVEGLERSGIVG